MMEQARIDLKLEDVFSYVHDVYGTMIAEIYVG